MTYGDFGGITLHHAVIILEHLNLKKRLCAFTIRRFRNGGGVFRPITLYPGLKGFV